MFSRSARHIQRTPHSRRALGMFYNVARQDNAPSQRHGRTYRATKTVSSQTSGLSLLFGRRGVRIATHLVFHKVLVYGKFMRRNFADAVRRSDKPRQGLCGKPKRIADERLRSGRSGVADDRFGRPRNAGVVRENDIRARYKTRLSLAYSGRTERYARHNQKDHSGYEIGGRYREKRRADLRRLRLLAHAAFSPVQAIHGQYNGELF